jgi:hypothetical protein
LFNAPAISLLTFSFPNQMIASVHFLFILFLCLSNHFRIVSQYDIANGLLLTINPIVIHVSSCKYLSTNHHIAMAMMHSVSTLANWFVGVGQYSSSESSFIVAINELILYLTSVFFSSAFTPTTLSSSFFPSFFTLSILH